MQNKRDKRTVAVSGGFDPLHIGHVRMFKKARSLGDRLIVILNNDNWLRAKKGYAFMPEKERAELLLALPFVDEVYITKHRKNPADMSVCDALQKVRPDMFGNGGDRRGVKDIPEAALCKQLGIKMIFNLGKGGKVQSSSWLVDAARAAKRHRASR
ncbi:MAG: adenylyltransferase/cytidyltransferase family protein [Patescibacteria group bacterium]